MKFEQITIDNIYNVAKEYLLNETDLTEQEFSKHSDLKHDLGLDSLNIVEIIDDIEKKLNVYIPFDQEERLNKSGNLLEFCMLCKQCMKDNTKIKNSEQEKQKTENTPVIAFQEIDLSQIKQKKPQELTANDIFLTAKKILMDKLDLVNNEVDGHKKLKYFCRDDAARLELLIDIEHELGIDLNCFDQTNKNASLLEFCELCYYDLHGTNMQEPKSSFKDKIQTLKDKVITKFNTNTSKQKVVVTPLSPMDQHVAFLKKTNSYHIPGFDDKNLQSQIAKYIKSIKTK
nr:hypothetical protein [Candidatus Enterousia merdequi]